MTGVWFAIDHADAKNGPLCYFPQSHKIPKYKDTVEECKQDLSGLMKYWEDQSKNFQYQEFYTEPGDVLIWHGHLLHGGDKRKDYTIKRRSFITHYSI